MTPMPAPLHSDREYCPVDRLGDPYAPVKARPWMTAAFRADLARQFDCHPAQVEFCLDARDRMDAYAAERMEREHPFTHRRPGARALTYAERVF